MKTYSLAPDVDLVIERVRNQHHEDLEGIMVSGLFAFDNESSICVLTHQGYPAGAVVRITPLRERALGIADVTIVVDRAGWLALSGAQRDALVDHELTHVNWRLDKETGEVLYDVLGRPKLAMRKHDHQMGWFDEVAQRHGESSPEVRQARRLIESSGQFYFDFGPSSKAA